MLRAWFKVQKDPGKWSEVDLVLLLLSSEQVF